MKRTIAVLVVFLGVIAFSGCEKDDICVDFDTPLLRIRFYDAFDTTLLKEVGALKVQGFRGDSVYPIIANISATEIILPLRIDTTSTSFMITRNLTPEDTTTVDIDILTLNYTLDEQFKSRACGFVMNFDNIQGEIPSINNWMKDIKIVTPALTVNDTIANVKIFH